MTKINDLVTVTVRNVFRNFLIDSERYELVDLVESTEALLLEGAKPDFSTIRNERIRSFLEGVDDRFTLGADNLVRVSEAGYPNTLPMIVNDRADRVSASLDRGDLREVWAYSGCPRCEIRCLLWSRFYYLLRKEHIKRGVLSGHGAES